MPDRELYSSLWLGRGEDAGVGNEYPTPDEVYYAYLKHLEEIIKKIVREELKNMQNYNHTNNSSVEDDPLPF